MLMTNEFHDWAVEAWKRGVLKNMPAARATRELKASQRESRKALASARLSLAASQAASQRKLNQHLAEAEKVFRDRREAQDRKFDELRWQLAMGKK